MNALSGELQSLLPGITLNRKKQYGGEIIGIDLPGDNSRETVEVQFSYSEGRKRAGMKRNYMHYSLKRVTRTPSTPTKKGNVHVNRILNKRHETKGHLGNYLKKVQQDGFIDEVLKIANKTN